MRARLLVLDIDGTLLTSRGVMSGATWRVLGECHAEGVLLCLATARSGRIVFRPGEVPGDAWFLRSRAIFYGGGTIVDESRGFYQHTPIPGRLVAEVVDAVGRSDDRLQVALQHDDIYHAFKHRMTAEELEPWGFRSTEILAFGAARERPATKIMVYSGTDVRRPDADLSHLHEAMCRDFGDAVNVVLADSRKALYILSRHASKGNAVRTVAGLHGIPAEQVAVFGDDTSDASMFGCFGYSVAMGNAVDSLKAAATFVTRTNDDEGLEFAIRSYLEL